MTFSINLPIVLKKTRGLKDFRKLYNTLLGFGITIIVDFLK